MIPTRFKSKLSRRTGVNNNMIATWACDAQQFLTMVSGAVAKSRPERAHSRPRGPGAVLIQGAPWETAKSPHIRGASYWMRSAERLTPPDGKTQLPTPQASALGQLVCPMSDARTRADWRWVGTIRPQAGWEEIASPGTPECP